ncbi:MAG TPA: Ig-like domain-containing protein, partial [Planctomycetota bacterium]|nr:Ig-like domain-containing protein [Planctomycetota bacterium]
TGDGTLGLDLVAGSNVTDPATNAVSNKPFTGQVYTVDRTNPAVTINQALGQADPASTAPIQFTAVFSENVSGFDATDVTVTSTGDPATVSVSGGPATYTVSLTPTSAIIAGTFTVTINAGAAADGAGNASAASTSTDNSVFYNPIIDRYWIATAAGAWSDPANWSDSASGAGGFSVPAATTRVFFGADGTKDGACTIDVAVDVRQLAIQAGYDGTITQGGQTVAVGVAHFSQAGGTFSGGTASFTVTGNFSVSGGAFTAPSATLAVSGDFQLTGGTFAANGGTLRLSGTAAGLALATGGQSLHHLSIAGSGSWTPTGTLSLTGNLLQTDGTFTAAGLVAVQGNVTVAGAGAPDLVLGASGELRLGPGGALLVGDGVAPGRLAASGAPKPRITTTGTAGTHTFSFTVASTGTLAVSALELFSLDANGLSIAAGAMVDNGTAGTLSGVDFDRIAAGGTYLRILDATGPFTVSNCSFGNTGSPNPFNISTPPGAAVGMVDARVANTGARAGDVYENDQGAGTDSNPATSTIRWSSPGAPTAVGQFRTDGLTAIVVGRGTAENTVVFKATAVDPENDAWTLEVEVRPVGTAFANAGVASAPAASGAEAAVSSAPLADGFYRWQYRLVDAGGNATGWVSFGGNLETATDFLKDTTNPLAGAVNDGPGLDIDWQNHTNSLSANWSGFSDPQSGVVAYRWAIGTTAGGADVLPFTDVGTARGSLATPALADGAIYYVTVEALNGAGLAVTAVSDGVRIDTTPPAAPTPDAVGGGNPVPGNDGVFLSWSSVTGATAYRLELATDSGFTNVILDLTIFTTSYTTNPLPAGTYYWRVTSQDAAGNWGLPSGTSSFVTTGSSLGVLTVDLGPSNPFASNEVNTATNLPVLQLRLTASLTEDVQLRTLVITGVGTLDDASHVAAAELWFDLDSDGTADPAVDLRLGTAQTYALDDGSVTFAGLALLVPAGQSRDVLLVYSLGNNAPSGSTFLARVAAASDLEIRGMTSGQTLLPQASFPLDGSTITIVPTGTPGGAALRGGVRMPSDGFVAANEQTVEMLQARLSASSVEDVSVLNVVLRASGTGDPVSGLSNVFLVEDRNGNGVFNAGIDRFIASGAFAADGTLTLALAEVLGAGQATHWLVVYDFSGGALSGQTFGIELRAADIVAEGASSFVPVALTGTDVTGAVMTTGTPGVTPALVTVSAVLLPGQEPVWP